MRSGIRKNWYAAVLAVVLLMSFAGGAFAANTASTRQLSDEEIAKAAVKAVRLYPFYSIFENINLAVSNGVVTLLGQVSQPNHKTDLGRIMAKVSGVRSVDNQLEVLPLSMMDNELRHRLARAIYRDPALQGYSLRADPPIHIIVKNGHVTLEGVVLTQLERALAERDARFAGTFFSLTNNLRVEKATRS